MAIEVWVATAPIYLENVRAYNINYIVPASVVTRFGLEAQGLVEKRTVPDESSPVNGVDPATQAELDALTMGAGRLSDASLSASYARRSIERQIVAQGLVVDDLTDAAAWSMTSGSGTVAAAAGELTITTTGATTVTAKRDLFLSLAGGRFLSFDIQRDANLETFDVNLAVAGDSSAKAWRVNETVAKINVGEWYRYTLPMSQAVSVGGATVADLADVRAMRFVVNPLAALDTTVRIRNIRLHENPLPPSVHFQFDDGRADTYSVAFPILATNGYTGGIAVEHTAVGNPDRCTLAQLQEMYAEGWSMYGHHTAQITDLTDAQALQVFKDAKAFLHTNSFRRGADHWVWPGGARDAAKEAIGRRFWQTMRKVNRHHWFSAPYVFERLDTAHYYIQTNTTLASATQKVDWVAERGGAIVFVFHTLQDPKVAQEDWTPGDFEALVEYAASKGLADTNFDQLYGGPGVGAFAA